MQLNSFAKINLTLDILNKREDNYHEVETILQNIDLKDIIVLEELKENKIIIKCNVKELENDKNIAFQAASLLKESYNINKGIQITIEKNIPIAAGLSGGSSNAATVLKGLNKLWNLNLTNEHLLQLARQIGMDVSFHILGGTCLGTGRGEILTKLSNLPEYYVIIIQPKFGVSSKQAYSNLDYNKIGKTLATKEFKKNYDLNYLHNDFEFSVFSLYPELEEIKNLLKPNSLLSGSGSCVYGLFEQNPEKLVNKLKEKYKVYLCKTT